MTLISLFITAIAGIYIGAVWVSANIHSSFGWWAGLFSGLLLTSVVLFGVIQILGRLRNSNA